MVRRKIVANATVVRFVPSHKACIVKQGERKMDHPHNANWTLWLEKLKGKPVTGMEVGVWTGTATKWFLENVFTHPSSKYFAIDTFRGDETHLAAGEDTSNLRGRFDETIVAHKNKVTVYEGRSDVMLSSHLPELRNSLDFCYIDGSHIARDVLQDTLLVWLCLKSGAILLWDDFGWSFVTYKGDPVRKHLHEPAIAIDAFLTCFDGQYKLMHKGFQVCVEKL